MILLYRYTDHEFEGEARIVLNKYLVVRETRCYWIINKDRKEKRIGKKSIRKWAWLLPTEAYESYKLRKLRQVEISIRNLNKSKKILDYIGVPFTEIEHFQEMGDIHLIPRMIDHDIRMANH